MYQQTRTYSDDVFARSQSIQQQRPLQYITSNVMEDRYMKHMHPENIDDSNSLRMLPTRLNYTDIPHTEIYGTAPNFSRGVNLDAIDKESSLKLGLLSTKHKTEHEHSLHVHAFTNEVIDVIPKSTRSDLRNKYSENLNYKRY